MTKTPLVTAMFLVVALGLPAAPTRAGPTVGGFASDGVEYVGHVPLNNDTAGARLLDGYLYLTTSTALHIYDVSEPEAPRRVGVHPLPQQPYFAEEDVDTNGKILLISSLGTLFVFDVEDKENPQILAQLAGTDEHTFSCVLYCTYAYGSEGAIVDLRKPDSPRVVGDWTEGKPATNSHDVTEVARGMVVTSSQPLMLLDARRNPRKPKLLAMGGNDDGRFMHGNLWPRKMKDRFLLVGGESGGPSCDNPSAAFMTWDASKWKRTRTFTMIDEYRVERGLPTDGDQVADLYCAHWFSTHPAYKDGGLVAMAWYEHGTRFLQIDKTGKISEAGWFIPYAGSTSAAYWVTDEIVYAVDYNRGLDILRFTSG
jgi:hypothetical protein